MKLSRKTFLYSISISTLLVGMIVIYFVAMLPSLYVDYMKKQYLRSVVEVEKGYMEKRSYEGLTVQNPTGSATVEIPLQGDRFYAAGKAFRFTFTVKNEKIKLVLDEIRSCFRNAEKPDREAFESIQWGLLKDVAAESEVLNDNAPFEIVMDFSEDHQAMKDNGSGRIYMKEQGIIVFEANAEDGDNRYTTYIAFGKTDDALVFSFLPIMTPQMKEIKPIVLGSVPMMAAVLFLIVLICSRYFSGKIVNPVIRLANYAEEVKQAGNLEIAPVEIREQDEIGELGRTLNELYRKLRENYEELEEKNIRLRKENQRQEVFLRASSHQLKTPVTAALLLVEGMIQEVGKYKDTKKYLPQVKEQLLSMRKIVEDILYLNHCTGSLQPESVELGSLMDEIAAAYKIQMKEKQLRYSRAGVEITVECDRNLLKKMMDNLVSNAVAYTDRGGSISVEIRKNAVYVRNSRAHIAEELLPHIYDPFVSGNGGQKGKGLGLYISAYYAEVLGWNLKIRNEERNGQKGVLAEAKFPENSISSSYEIHTDEVE